MGFNSGFKGLIWCRCICLWTICLRHCGINISATKLFYVWPRILVLVLLPLACQGCGFEFRLGLGSLSLVNAVLSGRGLFAELIIRPEESYLQWSVVLCDLETSRMRRPWPALGRSTEGNTCIWTINVCVCRSEGVVLLFIALVAVVRCSVQCRSNVCKKEGTFCLRVSLVEGHYSFQKIIIVYLKSMWRTNIHNSVFMKVN